MRGRPQKFFHGGNVVILLIFFRLLSKVSQHVSACKGADVSKLQAHQYMTPEQWTWRLRSVSVIPANKVSLQELNQSDLSW